MSGAGIHVLCPGCAAQLRGGERHWCSVCVTTGRAKCLTPACQVKVSDRQYCQICADRRKAVSEGGQALKFDQEKVAVELLPMVALVEVSRVLTYGAKKYAVHNWRKGLLWSRLLGGALRHLFAWATGEDEDPETGISHLAHAACCVLFLLEFTKAGGGTDDRWKGVAP